MKTFALVAVVATAVSFGAALPAAADGFAFSFNAGNLAFAYRDGYWDHYHHWHAWRNAREAREFSVRYHDHYRDWRHTRDRGMGWHEDHR